MAVTGVVKPFAYPDGLSSTDRWQFFHGNIVLSGTGNYAAGGIVLVWNPMTSATTGGNEFPLSLTTIPKFAYAYSGTGLPYVYTISPTTGNLLVAPATGRDQRFRHGFGVFHHVERGHHHRDQHVCRRRSGSVAGLRDGDLSEWQRGDGDLDRTLGLGFRVQFHPRQYQRLRHRYSHTNFDSCGHGDSCGGDC